MRRHALEFRAHEISAITRYWQQSQSCNVVGVGSVGKSNLVHQLGDADVLSTYMKGHDSEKFRAINIDPLMIGPLSAASTPEHRAWAGYELLMHRLFMSFYPFDMLTLEEARQFYSAYQSLQDGSNPLYAHMGVRYFELGLQFFLRKSIQIVILFDEFELLMRHMPVSFFQTLRGLRDQSKRQLSYTVFSRSPMEQIASHTGFARNEIEPFKELFSDTVVYVGPYTETDANTMLRDLCARSEIVFSSRLFAYVLASSGRFAGFLRSIFSAVSQRPEYYDVERFGDFLSRLVLAGNVRAECDTLLESLLPSEVRVVTAVAQQSAYVVDDESQQAVILLFSKSVLAFDSSKERLFLTIPVLSKYLM
jgi:hypothetical protein